MADGSYWSSPGPEGPGSGPAAGPLGPPPRPPRRRTALVAGIVVGLLLLGGGAVFAVAQFTGDGGSPEAAVRDLFEAVADEDVLGVIDALAPSERQVLAGFAEDLAAELQRLDVLSDDLDLGSVPGFDLAYDDLELSSEEVADDLALVTVEGGTFTGTVDPGAVPLGDFVTQFLGDDRGPVETDTEDLGADPLVLATVRDGGSWHVSLFTTLAEDALASSGAERPDPGEGIEAVGADSPTEAVAALVDSLLAVDLEGVIARFPPGEARVLRDYSPLFRDALDDLQRSAGGEVEASVSGVEYETSEVDGGTLVQLRGGALDLAVPGLGLRIHVEDGCTTVEDGTGPMTICGNDLGSLGAELEAELGVEVPDLDLGRPVLGLVTVEDGGQWYVSPLRTVAHDVIEGLRAFDRADLDELAQFFTELADATGDDPFGPPGEALLTR